MRHRHTRATPANVPRGGCRSTRRSRHRFGAMIRLLNKDPWSVMDIDKVLRMAGFGVALPASVLDLAREGVAVAPDSWDMEHRPRKPRFTARDAKRAVVPARVARWVAKYGQDGNSEQRYTDRHAEKKRRDAAYVKAEYALQRASQADDRAKHQAIIDAWEAEYCPASKP